MISRCGLAARRVWPRCVSPRAAPGGWSTAAPEDELHASVADALDKLLLPPARWTTFPAGSVPLPPRYAAKLSRLGLKRGWPDIQVVHGGRIVGIELKRRGGKLSRTRIVRDPSGAPCASLWARRTSSRGCVRPA